MPVPQPNPPRPRVLVTRAPDQGSDLADHLRALGADPLLIPAIELVPPTSWSTLDTALKALDTFHWLLFTSANAVEAFTNRVPHLQRQLYRRLRWVPPTSGDNPRVPHLRTASPSLGGLPPQNHPKANLPKIAAIGPATAKALKKIGLTPDLLPPQAVAESLTEALLPHTRQPDGTPTKFLLIRAEEARELLPESLRSAGAEVTVAPAYRTVIPESSVALLLDLFTLETQPSRTQPSENQPPAAITFTSSSTARNLLALCAAAGVALPESALRISIGPITTRTLIELGLPPHAEASEATVASLAQTTMNALLPPPANSTSPKL